MSRKGFTPKDAQKIVENYETAHGSSASSGSPTPETDGAVVQVKTFGEIIHPEFARRMERERNAARKAAEVFRAMVEQKFGTLPFPRRFDWENVKVISHLTEGRLRLLS